MPKIVALSLAVRLSLVQCRLGGGGRGGQDHIAPEHSPQKEIYNVSIVRLMAGASMNPLVLQIRRVDIEVIINPPLVFKSTSALRFLRLFSPMHPNLETIFTSQDTLRV